MRQFFVTTALLGATTLWGLSGCNNPPPVSEGTDSATETAASKADAQITIAGSGTPMSPLKIVATAYESQATAASINFLPSSQASAGIAGVKDGQLQIGTVSRQPKPEEAAEGLEYREFAKDALLVATHPSVEGVTNLTSDDLKAIYSGQTTNWAALGGPDAEIVVLDRPEDESAKQLLRTHYLGDELPNAASAVVLRKESELIAAIQNTSYSIGAFSLAQAVTNDLPVNRISLNSVAPSSETIENGTYPMVRSLGIVWFGALAPETQAFIDYLFSPEGARVLTESGLAPTLAAPTLAAPTN